MSKTTRASSASIPGPVPSAQRRASHRKARTLLSSYDPDVTPQVDLISDYALDDLAEPRLALLKRLFPRIVTLRVLSTAPIEPSGVKKFYVNTGGKDAFICTIAPADVMRATSEGMLHAKKAALNSPKIIGEARAAVYEGGYGANATRALLSGGDLASTLQDELRVSLLDASAPGRSLVPLPRQIWQRGAPLHELAVETAVRTSGYAFVGEGGMVNEILGAIVQRLARLLPGMREEYVVQLDEEGGEEGAPAGEEEAEEEVVEVSEAVAEPPSEEDGIELPPPPKTEEELVDEAVEELRGRLSPKLMKLIDGTDLNVGDWKCELAAYRRGLFATCPDDLLTDAACAPLVACLKELKLASGASWSSACPKLPSWCGGWEPLRVNVHGDLRACNILLDGQERKLHYVGFGPIKLAAVFYDVAKLVATCLLGCVRLEKGGEGAAAKAANAAEQPSSPEKLPQNGSPAVETGGSTAGAPAPASPPTLKRALSQLGEKRLGLLCSCIDVLLPEADPYMPGSGCCHENLLVISSLPIADIVPEDAPEDIKAAILISQQMIEGGCRTALAAAAAIKDGMTNRPAGIVNARDLHPINLLLPLLLHSLELVGSAELSIAQQRGAWHLTRRCATLVSAFLTSGGGEGLSAGDAAMAREVANAKKEAADVKREADGALSFERALVERLKKELEDAKVAVKEAKAAAKEAAKAAEGDGGGGGEKKGKKGGDAKAAPPPTAEQPKAADAGASPPTKGTKKGAGGAKGSKAKTSRSPGVQSAVA